MTAPPVSPAAALKNGAFPGPLINIKQHPVSIDVAADGSFWMLNKQAVWLYSRSAARFEQIVAVEGEIYQDAWDSGRIAAVSSDAAYYISSSGIWKVDRVGRTSQPVLALPDPDGAYQLTATYDGYLWALGMNRLAYRLDPGASIWVPTFMSQEGSLSQISAGSADNVVGVGTFMDLDEVLWRYEDGVWKQRATSSYSWVAACPDGSYWGLFEQALMNSGRGSKDPTLVYAPVNNGRMFAAGHRHACYFFDMESYSSEGNAFTCVAHGVVDQPDSSFPRMTKGELAAYDELSRALDVTDTHGLRGAYGNINAPISSWPSRIRALEVPPGVDESDWDSTKSAILAELECVQTVDSLFEHLAIFNNTMAVELMQVYEQVVHRMEIPADPVKQPKSVVNAVLGVLVEKGFQKALSALPFHVGEVVNLGLDCYKAAARTVAQNHETHPTRDAAVHIECSKLAATLEEMNTEQVRAMGEFQIAVLTDYQRLLSAGRAIGSGVWYMSPDFSTQLLAGVGQATKLQFFQTLMPARWQILHHLVRPEYAPSYAFMFQWLVLDDAMITATWFCTCVELTAKLPTDADYDMVAGPFPPKAVLAEIFALDTTPLDFFTGEGGWSLPTQHTPGASTPAPAEASWEPYETPQVDG